MFLSLEDFLETTILSLLFTIFEQFNATTVEVLFYLYCEIVSLLRKAINSNQLKDFRPSIFK